jgi:hypothetical protein
MAEIHKNIWGQLSGRIGNTVVRVRNRKAIVYSLPRKYKPADSAKLQAERGKFGLTIQFAKFINNIPLLKQTWRKADINGTNAYQRIIKYNAGKNTSAAFTKKNIITPPGIPLLIKEVSLTHFGISTVLEMFKGTNSSYLPPFTACAVIYFYNPVNEKDIVYSLITISTIIDEIIDGEEFSITLPPVPEYLNAVNNYKNSIIYMAIIKEESPVNNLIWTSTAANVT